MSKEEAVSICFGIWILFYEGEHVGNHIFVTRNKPADRLGESESPETDLHIVGFGLLMWFVDSEENIEGNVILTLSPSE